MNLKSILLYILFFNGSVGSMAQQVAVEHSAKNFSNDTVGLHLLIKKAKPLVYQNPDSALAYLTKAIGVSERWKLQKQLAESKSMAGVAYYVKAEYDRALPLFTDALEIYLPMQDHNGLSACYNHLGLIYQTQKRYNKAITYHRRGIRHAREIGNINSQATNHFNIALAYDETGRYDSAVHYLEASLDQSRSIGFHRLIIMSLNRLAKVNFHQDRHTVAEKLYDSAFNYPVDQNNWERCFALAGMAEVYDAQGLYDKAIASGLKSFELAKSINAKWDILHVGEILSRAYANQGSFKKAYDMALAMQAIKDSVFNEEKENKLNYIHLKEHELAKANLEKENALQSVSLKEKDFQVATAVVISASLLIIMFVLFSRQRQKNKLNKQLIANNQKIEQQNQELNELNESKNRLLSIISHDLRSPFINLQNLLMMAREGHISETERSMLFERLELAFSSASGTLESLLHWAHSQIENVPNIPEVLNVDEIIQTTHEFWEPAIRKKEIALSFSRNGYSVSADPYQLNTIIRNILGNAVKFTEPKGSIAIDTIQRDDKVGIIIRDNGVGMPQSIRENLFSFQRQNQRAGTMKESGSGIGLMISRQLLEKNGGSIEVESEEGKGSTFTLWVPST